MTGSKLRGCSYDKVSAKPPSKTSTLKDDYTELHLGEITKFPY